MSAPATNNPSMLTLGGRPVFEYRVDDDGTEYVRDVVDGEGAGGWALLTFQPPATS